MTVTTASQTQEGANRAPATMVVITQEQIRMRGYRSVNDIIMDLPEMMVTGKSWEEMTHKVSSRGLFGARYILLMINGQRVSAATGEEYSYAEHFPLFMAKQVEILLGPASALYGPDAVSGVINIVTDTQDTNDMANVDLNYANGNYMFGNAYLRKRIADDAAFSLGLQAMDDQGFDLADRFEEMGYDLSDYQSGTFNTEFGPMTPEAPFSTELTAPRNSYAVYANLRLQDLSVDVFTNMYRFSTAMPNSPSNAIYNDDVFFKQRVTSAAANYRKAIGDLTFLTTLQGLLYNLDPNSN